MTTRYTAKSKTRFHVPGLPSGYNDNVSTTQFTVPPVGIEDVDLALYELFDKEIPLNVGGDNTDMKRCPVVFFAGEKWALNKRLRALKDRNNALILPLCTAVRTQVTQDPVTDITGRGINQQTGEIVIHRRLDNSDRDYQQLINRLLIQNQQNLAVGPNQASPGQLSTLRTVGDLAETGIVEQGGLLVPNRQNNIIETIVIPAPQFFTAQYDVTLWTQYTTHMNQLIESIIASQLPQGNVWKIETKTGYWFLANVVDNSYTADTNTDDYSQTERLVMYKFVIRVPGYILASRVPGAPVPIKRYVSSPSISFDVGIAPTGNTMDEQEEGIDDPLLGADDPTLPLISEAGGVVPPHKDQRDTRGTRLYPGPGVPNPDDPARKLLPRGTRPDQYQKVTGIDKNGNKVTRLFRVKGSNSAQGETVLAAEGGLGGLTIVVTED